MRKALQLKLSWILKADQEKAKAVLDFRQSRCLTSRDGGAIQNRSLAMLLEIKEGIRSYMIDLILNGEERPDNAQQYADIIRMLIDLCPLVIEQIPLELVEIFGDFIGGDLESALAITEKKDVALLKWLLIYDKRIIDQVKDKSKSPDETMRFMRRVMQNLQVDSNELVPSYTKVLQQLKELQANISYYIFDQLECCLIAALERNDTVAATAVVAALRDTIAHNLRHCSRCLRSV